MSEPTGSEPDAGESRYERGLRVRREVLGAEYVARALAGATELDADFQRFLTETAWGTLWARPDLDRRTRSLITIAILAALGRREELALHLRATRNTGASRERHRRGPAPRGRLRRRSGRQRRLRRRQS